MEKIKIAPSFDEVKVVDNKIVTDFNRMHIEFVLDVDSANKYRDDYLKEFMCGAIAMADRLWQLPVMFIGSGINGKCYVDGEYIEHPEMQGERKRGEHLSDDDYKGMDYSDLVACVCEECDVKTVFDVAEGYLDEDEWREFALACLGVDIE